MVNINCMISLVLVHLVSHEHQASIFDLQSFTGDIYLASDILEGHSVAVKLELTTNRHQTLEHKFHVLKTLGGGVGFPTVHWFGSEEGYNAIIFDCLGPSLEELFVCSNHKFSGGTISNLALQLVSSFACVKILHTYCHIM